MSAAAVAAWAQPHSSPHACRRWPAGACSPCATCRRMRAQLRGNNKAGAHRRERLVEDGNRVEHKGDAEAGHREQPCGQQHRADPALAVVAGVKAAANVPAARAGVRAGGATAGRAYRSGSQLASWAGGQRAGPRQVRARRACCASRRLLRALCSPTRAAAVLPTSRPAFQPASRLTLPRRTSARSRR